MRVAIVTGRTRPERKNEACQQNLLCPLGADQNSIACQKNPESEATGASEITVLVLHTDPVISAGLTALLRTRRDFKVLGSASRLPVGPEVSPNVVIADYHSGMRLTATASDSHGQVIILTDSDSQTKICRALAQGVRGYLLLGCSLEDLVTGIRSVYEGGVAMTPRVATRIAESLRQETLTEREQSVFRQIALGQSNKRIALEYGLAVGTVKTHVKSILRKLDAGNRGEAVAIARRRGILPEEIESPVSCGTRGMPQLTQDDNENAVARNGAGVRSVRSGSSLSNGIATGDRRKGSTPVKDTVTLNIGPATLNCGYCEQFKEGMLQARGLCSDCARHLTNADRTVRVARRMLTAEAGKPVARAQ